MYNPSNFIITLNTNQIINVVTGGTASLVFNIKNIDLNNSLYNLSFDTALGDGIELISSSVPYTQVVNNTFSFINIKDLAPNEINYNFSITIKLNTTTRNGSIIPFGSIIPCTFRAYADTMPRGSYDNENVVIESTYSFSLNASKHIIYKVNPSKLLLGKTYSSKIIIQTAENSSILINNIIDTLGNGLNYLGNITITGYSSTELSNVQITPPNNSHNSYILSWSNVYIPKNHIVTIQYDVLFNERYYLNGIETGAFIENSTSITNVLSGYADSIDFLYNYYFIAYEVLLEIVMSKYVVDINESITYNIEFYSNLYHDLLGLSGYLNTSDGQILNDSSIPMYTTKTISEAGLTQVTWNVGTIIAGTTTNVVIDGEIATKYISSQLDILSGDTFNISANCNGISGATNKIISSSDSTSLNIGLPYVSKIITGYYYRDNTPKPFNVLSPGDYISYRSTYNSLDIIAPSNRVKLFDFYPYMTKDILDITYDYSSSQYPGTDALGISPNGVLWYITNIPGNQSFSINYKTQIDYINSTLSFPYNLFKMQVVNSDGISFSSRDQIGFKLGKPNLKLNKNIVGNNINKIKIGEIYSIITTLKNDNSDSNATDAFNFVFTETIPNNITLNSDSIIAKINNIEIPFIIQDNLIKVDISNLAPNEIFTLSYNVSINDTLGPNKYFTFNSQTSIPYTQPYDANNTNLQYDIGTLSSNVTLKSEPISLTLSSDAANKIVGDIVFYSLSIKIPMGQRLSSLSPVFLIPSLQIYLNEAWLNDTPITATPVNNTVVFPSITNIDTTSNEIIYNYKIKCLVNNSIVSTQNPLYTVENYYANLSFTTILNITSNLGINNFITVNHPHIDLTIASSNVMSGFTQSYLVYSDNIIYTNITAENLGLVNAKNIEFNVVIPNYLNFNSIQSNSSGVTASYDIITRVLNIKINTINNLSNKYLIIKSNILPGPISESKLIITGTILGYYNTVSEAKKYTSDAIYNCELYLKSFLSFLPLSFYSLINSDAAINLSKIGELTKIEYILTNKGQGIDSYRINITPISYPYDIYIGSTFVESVSTNTSLILNSPLLADIFPRNSKYIRLVYTIPNDAPSPFYETMLVKTTSLNNINTNKTIPTTLQDP